MKTRLACLATLLALGSAAHAATPVYLTVDHSTEAVLDNASAQVIWKESLSDKLTKLAKLYPTKRWGFVSEVEGGFTASKTCVITARAMMLPVTVSGKTMLFKPNKTATTFDAVPGATKEQCTDLAKTKLKEAVQGVLSSLIAS